MSNGSLMPSATGCKASGRLVAASERSEALRFTVVVMKP